MAVLSPADLRRASVLRSHGIVFPIRTVLAAKWAGLALPRACALLQKESGDGRMLWGHDRTIFVGGDDVKNRRAYGPYITEDGYRAYLAQRGPTGRGGMQGVGSTQLTWYGFQDQADKLGGCWKVLPNMKTGFQALAHLITQYGEEAGAAAYNGTGPAARAYGEDFVVKAEKWRRVLA